MGNVLHAAQQPISTHHVPTASLMNNIAFMNQVIQNTLNAIIITDDQGLFSCANPSFLSMWEYTSCSMTHNMLWRNLFDLTDNEEDIFQSLDIGHNWTGELIAIRENKERFNVRACIAPIKNENNQIISLVISCENITQLKDNEEIIKREFQTQTLISLLYQLSLENQSIEKFLDSVLFYITNFPLLRLDHNYAVYRYNIKDRSFELPVKRYDPKPEQQYHEIIPFDDTVYNLFMSIDLPVFVDKTDTRNNYYRLHTFGNYFIPIKICNQTAFYLICVSTTDDQPPNDNTAKFIKLVIQLINNVLIRKHTEAALIREKELISNVISNIPLHVFWKDRSLRFIGCNEHFAQACGFSSPHEIIGKTDFDLHYTDEEAEEYQKTDREVIESGQEKLNLEQQRKLSDGQILTFKTSKVPFRNRQGDITGILGISTDITQQKKLEQQLSLAQKMESIGELAAGIAHEINTPMQYIQENTHFIRDSWKSVTEILNLYTSLIHAHHENNDTGDLVAKIDELQNKNDFSFLQSEIPAALKETGEGIQRVIHIIKSMKEFSHPGVSSKVMTDLNKSIKSTITITRNEWKYVADIEYHLEDNLPRLLCFPGKINQVLSNLIVNASHAIKDVVDKTPGEKGKITFTTHSEEDYIEIRVQDSGTGIPKEIMTKIFDPFFTTKDVNKGTGQGLSIAHSIIVDHHKGTIECESELGHGTTFIIRLPREDEE